MALKAKRDGDRNGDGERGDRWVRFLPPHLYGGANNGGEGRFRNDQPTSMTVWIG